MRQFVFCAAPTSRRAVDHNGLSDADADFGRIETVKEKGFYILPSHLFANVRQKARNDANLP